MPDHVISRWLSPLMAFCLSFIIIATLAPVTGIQIERQIDFWLLWLLTMIIVALPICYLEIALAKRSKTTALNALSALTRDAEASPKWRIVGWLAVIFIPFLSGGILSNASQILTSYALPQLMPNTLLLILAVVSLIVSFIPRQLLVILIMIAVIAALILANMFGINLPEWKMTSVGFAEWGNATILALVASGLGLGLYWQSSLTAVQHQDVATKVVIPIWIAQLLAVIAFGFFAIQAQIPAHVFSIAVIMTSALLLQMAREQLFQRGIVPIFQWIILLFGLLVWAIPQMNSIFNHLLVMWGLIICLIYAIFVGWIMKISHLRKSMNFSHEIFYNLWRIAVRIILPLVMILAMIAYVGYWLA
ncbi:MULTISPECIES: hypothetical protein [unclassified Acinetobacter]|uniref:hypothetical protein n=1 Tax=unclassified Acinetobacter TaxID=196816 RepID=UPI0029348607|nr:MULTISPECIES: hypothetical protein [unclassified Acinetobacter]WOE32984.1 hypothetical protein QSG84_07515 [Acinetobacter sp. SAAs470]WOE38462.1 hypothetical protein QSG86_01180 [Acinetobacter sp. SAAs474]